MPYKYFIYINYINGSILVYKRKLMLNTAELRELNLYLASLQCDVQTQTPLHMAVYEGRVEIVCMLITAGSNINMQNEEGETPLYIASKLCYVEIVKMLITAGCDVNICNKLGETPLYIVSFYGYDNVVCELINAGCETDIPNNKEETPLHVASAGGYGHIVIMLIKANCNIISIISIILKHHCMLLRVEVTPMSPVS